MSSAPTPARPQKNASTIELGPDLPIAEFTSTHSWDAERIHGLALYCSDGRWGHAFDEFCQSHLRLPRYDRWAVPGGPAWLAAGGGNSEFTQTPHEQLDFLVQAHELDRIILITHFGCAHYAQRLQAEADECLPIQIHEVRLAAETLLGWYPQMRIESYVAMRSGNRLSFHGVT